MHSTPFLTKSIFTIFINRVRFNSNDGVLTIIYVRNFRTRMTSLCQAIRLCNLPSTSKFRFSNDGKYFSLRIRNFAFLTIDSEFFIIRGIRGQLFRAHGLNFLQARRIRGRSFILTLLRPTSQRRRDLLQASPPRSSRYVAIRPCRSFSPNERIRRNVSNLIRYGNYTVMNQAIRLTSLNGLLINDGLNVNKRTMCLPSNRNL